MVLRGNGALQTLLCQGCAEGLILEFRGTSRGVGDSSRSEVQGLSGLCFRHYCLLFDFPVHLNSSFM